PWSYDRQLYKHRNIIERYFLRLKRFRKVFTRYNKLNFIFISTISLSFMVDAIFM
ncbi:MAG: transposase, partial [Firmicutes bacterium]|nr:transposase [Bacillota bacterium]